MKPPAPVIALLIVGALLLEVGAFTRSWVTAGRGDFSFNMGLNDGKACGGGDECQTVAYTEMLTKSKRGRDVAMAATGMATFGLSILAMIFAVIFAITFITKTPKSVLGV